jgi:hypothetical protein
VVTTSVVFQHRGFSHPFIVIIIISYQDILISSILSCALHRSSQRAAGGHRGTSASKPQVPK